MVAIDSSPCLLSLICLVSALIISFVFLLFNLFVFFSGQLTVDGRCRESSIAQSRIMMKEQTKSKMMIDDIHRYTVYNLYYFYRDKVSNDYLSTESKNMTDSHSWCLHGNSVRNISTIKPVFQWRPKWIGKFTSAVFCFPPWLNVVVVSCIDNTCTWWPKDVSWCSSV